MISRGAKRWLLKSSGSLWGGINDQRRLSSGVLKRIERRLFFAPQHFSGNCSGDPAAGRN